MRRILLTPVKNDAPVPIVCFCYTSLIMIRMQLQVIALCFVIGAAPGLARAETPTGEPVAWVELGPVNVEHGLSVPNARDGQNDPAVIGGAKCRVSAPESRYIYFDYDRRAGRLRRPVYITVEYFDEGLGKFQIQYDSTDAKEPENGAYKNGGTELLLDSRQWRKVTFEIFDARFDSRQNLGGDFRLFCRGRIAVRKAIIEMEHSENYEYLPQAQRDRVAASVGRLSPPKDVKIVFSSVEPRNIRDIPRALAEIRALAPMVKILGATSLETYVRWDLVEPLRGVWDWSFYDRVADILRENGLRWSPRLVTGDAQSIPAWFAKSATSACTEDRKECWNQPVWNPQLSESIERFISQFALRYGVGSLIESVSVGYDGCFQEGPLEALGKGDHEGSFRWDRGLMTRYAAVWLSAVRRLLPRTSLYFCINGQGAATEGYDVSAVCKIAADYDAGVQIEKEGSDYGRSFAETRLIASAARHYGAYYAFGPAGVVTADGLTARIYNNITAGTSAIHVRYPNVLTEAGGSAAWSSSYQLLGADGARRPPVAVLLSQSTLSLHPGNFCEKAALLRDAFEFDIVDESMIRDGALQRYEVLLLVDGAVIDNGDAQRIVEWMRSGGVVVACDSGGLKTVDGGTSHLSAVFDYTSGKSPTIREHGAGLAIYVAEGWEDGKTPVEELVRVLGSLCTRTQSNLVPDGLVDGVYVSEIGDRLLILNTTGSDIERELQVEIGRRQRVALPARKIIKIKTY
ncbi:MAG: beta-galactosidase [Armatimonadetes bacterium]|nr:beta-galactosidase [Armatimonadota bacterium]